MNRLVFLRARAAVAVAVTVAVAVCVVVAAAVVLVALGAPLITPVSALPRPSPPLPSMLIEFARPWRCLP